MKKKYINIIKKDVSFDKLDDTLKFLHNIMTFNLKLNSYNIALVLSNNNYIKELNKLYRNKDEATDILSFSYNESDEILKDIEGDLILSLEYIKLNAENYNVSFASEFKRVLIHGILHLMGFKHETNDFKREEMLILQEKILRDSERLFKDGDI